MSLKAELRTQTGTGAARKARQEGKIPASLYGKEDQAISLLVDRREFEALLKKEGANAVVNVEFDGKSQQVLIKDFQKAALADELYSVDFQAVSANQKLQVEVPVVLVNVESVKEGVVELVLNHVLVETTPSNIPSSIEVDVEGLSIGEGKTVADLVMPANVEVLTEAEETVVTVGVPTELTIEDEEVFEPEVVGEEESAE